MIRLLCQLLVGLSGAALGVAQAQSPASGFPSRPVHITTPYSTGIAPDVTTRILADHLSRRWGQSVVVEPRPGASGTIAIEQLRKGAADGHELLILGNAHLTVNPVLIRNWVR